MLRYIVQRSLLIPPKFFVISVLIFAILNLAGSPPTDTSGGQGGQSASGAANAKSYLAFRQQFHLDKPTVINLRWLTSSEEVLTWLRASTGLDAEATPKERSRAEQALDDYGRDLVPHLMPVLLGDGEGELRRRAAERLATAAQEPMLPEGALPAPERKAANDAAAEANRAMRTWVWGPDAPPEEAAAVTAKWRDWWGRNDQAFRRTAFDHLWDTAFDTRFAWYWSNLLRLDLGESTVTHRPVVEIIGERVPYSLALALCSIFLAYLLALPIGVYSATRPGTPLDTGLTITLFLLFSLPSFFTGTVLLKLLATGVDRVFPTGGFVTPGTEDFTALQRLGDVLWHLVLPVATYASVSLAALSRYARTGIIDVIRADFVRTARAKGLHELVVIVKHAARNGMLPILTLLGSLLAQLVGGSVVIETVFNIPGMGLYLFESIAYRDYNAVMGVILFSSLLTLVGVFLADLSYALADPRISYE